MCKRRSPFEDSSKHRIYVFGQISMEASNKTIKATSSSGGQYEKFVFVGSLFCWNGFGVSKSGKRLLIQQVCCRSWYFVGRTLVDWQTSWQNNADAPGTLNCMVLTCQQVASLKHVNGPCGISFYCGPNGYDRMTSQIPCAAWLMKVVGSHDDDSDDEASTSTMVKSTEKATLKVASLWAAQFPQVQNTEWQFSVDSDDSNNRLDMWMTGLRWTDRTDYRLVIHLLASSPQT